MSFVGEVLHNPLYAGAYVYGRRPLGVVFKDGQARKKQRSAVAAEDATVFIPDHHEGYIAWDVYQRNQAIMRGNRGNFVSDDATQSVRSGQGLLSGLLRCARCGHKLHIRYWGKSGTAARYLCAGDFETGGSYCIGFGGATVDKRFGELILGIISPHGLEASLAAIARAGVEGNDRRTAFERKRQQVRYEVERAFAQYDQADPNNRLVADVLEQRWNAKLEDQHCLEQELDELSEVTAALGADDALAIRALGENFAAVWNDPQCPMTLKKRITRTLIEEIMVDLDESAQELHMVVHWHGGSHTAFTMPKPLSGAVAHKTALEDVELITKMARCYRDDEIARVLSKLGRRTGKGNRWTQPRVATVRRKHAIAPPDVANLDPDILTLGKATEHTGVSDTTIMRLIAANILAATQVAPYAPLEIRRKDLDSEPVAGILRCLKETGKLVLDGMPPGEQASLFEVNQ